MKHAVRCTGCKARPGDPHAKDCRRAPLGWNANHLWVESSAFEVWLYWSVLGFFLAGTVALCVLGAMQ